mgnify:CR=1 FL=1
MKLEKPKLYRSVFNQFLDERGYLNPLDVTLLSELIGTNFFYPIHQLMSFSAVENTFRGFHFQKDPFRQAKLLIVHSGEILDLVVPFDNARSSMVEEFEMVAGDVLFIPDSYAHGFLTKSPAVSLQYLLNKPFNSDCYTGINGVDYLRLVHSVTQAKISDKDSSFINFIELDD